MLFQVKYFNFLSLFLTVKKILITIFIFINFLLSISCEIKDRSLGFESYALNANILDLNGPQIPAPQHQNIPETDGNDMQRAEGNFNAYYEVFKSLIKHQPSKHRGKVLLFQAQVLMPLGALRG